MIEPRYFVMGVAIVGGAILGFYVPVYFLGKYLNATLAVLTIIFILFLGYYVGLELQEAAL